MINSINHITLAVKDIERSFKFYQQVLGLQPLCRWHQGAYFLVGTNWFCLSQDKNLSPIDSGYTHYAFSVDLADFEKLSQKIKAANCHIFKENSSEGDSLYFCDPDGHQLEIHVGNWQTRLRNKQIDPGRWGNIEFFVDI